MNNFYLRIRRSFLLLILGIVPFWTSAQSITTSLIADNGNFGSMFDVVVNTDIRVSGFDINMDAGTWTVQVWVTPQPYSGFESDPNAWRQVMSTSITSTGSNLPTFIPFNLDIAIPAGATYGFLITVQEGALLNYLTSGIGTEGSVFVSDGNVSILVGRGMNAGFSPGANDRVWSGTMYYTVSPAPDVTSLGSVSNEANVNIGITGTDFDDINNLVYFYGNQNLTTSDLSTQVQVNVPQGTAHGPVMVLNQGSNLIGVSEEHFMPTFSGNASMDASSFASSASFTLGFPYNIELADIDSDGITDVVITDLPNVQVFRNISSTGTISLETPVTIPTLNGMGPDADHIALGDMDQDGLMDIVIGNGIGTIEVFRNTSTPGTISFAAGTVNVCGSTTNNRTVQTDDIDRDGKLDIIMVDETGFQLCILRNVSSPGSLAFEFGYSEGYSGSQFNDISTGDLDGDGLPELIITIDDQLTIRENRSSQSYIDFGNFAFLNLNTGAIGAMTRPGDIDNDGQLDVVSTDANGRLSIFPNQSSGDGDLSFGGRIDITHGETPTNLALGDLDGDGTLDVVVNCFCFNDGSATIIENNSTPGSFNLQLGPVINLADGNVGVAIGDLDMDKRPEIISADRDDGTMTILLNDVGLPDLTGGFLRATPRTVKELTQVGIYGEVYNFDGLENTVSGTIDLWLSDDSQFDGGDQFLSTIPMSSVDAGSFISYQTVVTIPAGFAGGDYFIIAYVDASDTNVEFDENNNTAAESIRIEDAELPATPNFTNIWGEGGTLTDEMNGMTVDVNGNIITVGALDFGSGLATKIHSFSPTGSVNWFNNNAGLGRAMDVDTDAAGNVYVTGHFIGSIFFPSTTLNSNGGDDVYVVKFDQNGNEIWARSFGSTNNDWGTDVAVDDLGNVYVTGWYTDAFTFNAVGVPITSAGLDMFLVKYDNLGNEVWSRTGGGTLDDVPNAIVVDENSVPRKIYIAGVTQSAAITVGGFGYSNTGASGSDYFVASYDEDGSFNWARMDGGDGNNDIQDISIDSQGNLYVTGFYAQSSLVDSDNYLPFYGDVDFFLAKMFNSSGGVQWIVTGGGPFSDIGRGVHVDSNDDIYVTGVQADGMYHQADLVGTAGAFYGKIDDDGEVQWFGSASDTGFGEGWSVRTDGNQNLIISGRFNGSITAGSQTQTGFGNLDLFTAIAGPTPDLVLSDGGLSRGIATSDFALGFMVNVTNQGNASAGSSTLRTYFSTDQVIDAGEEIESGFTVGSLVAGGTERITGFATIPSGTADGDYYIIVSVDADGSVSETQENNNQESVAIRVESTLPQTNQYFDWVTSGGSSDDDYANDVEADASGNVFIAGTLGPANNDFESNSGGFAITVDGNGPEAFLMKTDSNGDILWIEDGGGTTTSTDRADAVTVDTNGEPIITGRFYGNATFDAESLTEVGIGIGNAFIVKYDTDGNSIWSNTVAADLSWGIDIDSDNSNNVYVMGWVLDFGSGVDFGGGTVLNGDGTWNFFLARYNSSGVLDYARLYGNNDTVFAFALDVDPVTQEVYISGRFQGSNVDFGGQQFTSVNDGNDLFVAKYDFNGDLAWVTTAGGNGTDNCRDVAFHLGTTQNRVLITGYFNETITTPLGTLNAGSTNDDAFVGSLDPSDGTLQWINNLGSSVLTWGHSIDVNSNGNVIIAGPFSDPSLTAGSFTIRNNGEDDVFMAEFSLSDGTLVNLHGWGGTNTEFINSIHVADNKTYLVGYFRAAVDFDDGTTVAFGWGNDDMFVVQAPLDNEPPMVSITPPSLYVLDGSAQVLSATITDNLNVSSVDLEYTGLDDGNTFYTPMAAAGVDTYTIDLGDVMNDGSNNATDRIGYQLNVFAFDDAGNQGEAGSFFVHYQYPNGLVVNNTGVDRIGFGTTTEDYRMFSVPLNLTSPSAAAVIGDEFGSDDPNNEAWAIYHYSGGSAQDHKTSSISLGEGYWLLKRTSSPSSFGTGRGTTANVDFNGFTMNLQQGWNQIGNPYNFILGWVDVLNFNGDPAEVSDLAIYTGSYDQSVLELWPGEGAYVFADNAISIDIPTTLNTTINTRTNGDRQRREVDFNAIDEKTWNVVFNLESSEFEGLSAGIGMNPDAKSSKDRFDKMRIPRFGKYLDATFEHPEFFQPEFSTDIVPSAEEHIWNFKVDNNLASVDVTISWENDFFGYNGKNLVLFDMNDNVMIDMREESEYTFSNMGEREFKVYYGSETFIHENVVPDRVLINNFPNPFITETSFQLGIPREAGNVRIDIYNSLGQWVTNLFNGALIDGFHNIRWDGRSDKGATMNSGLYIYKITVVDSEGRHELNGRLVKR